MYILPLYENTGRIVNLEMSKAAPEISVLISYYNDRAFLRQSIQAVLSQTFKDFELILINHATQDDCREIARSFDDPRIVHVDLEFNNGAGGGFIFETLIGKARGKYIKLFCADDVMKSDCLEKLHSYLASNPDKDIVFGDARLVDKNGSPKKLLWSERFADFSFEDDNLSLLKKFFDKKSFLPLPACLFKRTAADGLKIDKSLIIEFDQSLWIQMMMRGANFGFTRDVVCDYRVHKLQCSSIRAENRVDEYDFYESIMRAKLFYGIKDFVQLERLLGGYEKKFALSEKDVDFFPFATACYYLEKHENLSCKIAGYEYLHDCMEDPTARQKIKERFNFTVADFRLLYKNSRAFNPSMYLEYIGIKGGIAMILKKLYEKLFGQPYAKIL